MDGCVDSLADGFPRPSNAYHGGNHRLPDDIMFLLIAIGVFVGYLMVRTIQLFNEDANPVADRVQHGTVLEIVWTVTPH